MFFVSFSISTKTGFAFSNNIEFEEAIKLKGVVITSSPSFMPSALTHKCNPAVPELTAKAYFVPIYFENLLSNSNIFGPMLNVPDFRTFSTSFMSFFVISGLANGIIKLGNLRLIIKFTKLKSLFNMLSFFVVNLHLFLYLLEFLLFVFLLFHFHMGFYIY